MFGWHSKLTGWHLDVKSESTYNQDMKAGYDSLLSLPNMSPGLADALYEKGLYSADEVAAGSVEELQQAWDFSKTDAEALIEGAQTFVLNREKSAAENAGDDSSAESAEDESLAESSPESTMTEEVSPPDQEDSGTNDQGDGTAEPAA